MTNAIAVSGEAAEVALGEAQAVLAMVQDDERRGRLAELLELGLQTGRIRAQYGPGGEQAALRLFRKLPRGQELSESAREVSGALASLVGKPLTGARIEATGPGTFLVSLSTDGIELSARLDRNGVRLTSVGL